MSNFPEIPEAQDKRYVIKMMWENNPNNPDSGFDEWKKKMEEKGYMVTCLYANGTTAPFDVIRLEPFNA